MHQVTDFDGERFMIQVRLLAGYKNLVHDNQVAKCDITVCQTPNVFFNSPSLYTVYCITVYCFDIVSVNCLLNFYDIVAVHLLSSMFCC